MVPGIQVNGMILTIPLAPLLAKSIVFPTERMASPSNEDETLIPTFVRGLSVVKIRPYASRSLSDFIRLFLKKRAFKYNKTKAINIKILISTAPINSPACFESIGKRKATLAIVLMA
jgi:hypothetical protein